MVFLHKLHKNRFLCNLCVAVGSRLVVFHFFLLIFVEKFFHLKKNVTFARNCKVCAF